MSCSYRTVAAASIASLLAATSYAAPAKTKSHAVVGTLQSVEGQTITVQTPKGPETVILVPSSRIHRGAATIPAADLSSFAGQRIKIRYVDSTSGKQAQSVTLPSASKSAEVAKPVRDPGAKPAARAAKK